MSSLYKAYTRFLFRFPIASQALQTGILMGTGDVISQTVVEKRPLKKVDLVRTAQFFSVGAFFLGPVIRVWYGVLHKHVGSGGKTVALKKVALDQIVFAPVCLVCVMTLIKSFQGSSLPQIKEAFRRDYVDIMIANYKLWPMVQMVNFYFVPLHYQVLLVQTVALAWNTYLAYKTRPSDEHSKE